MRNNEVRYGVDSRCEILDGITNLRKAVEVTLGPKGRNVIIDRGDDVVVVNDGITIANNLRYSNHYHDMGVKLVTQSAFKTNEKSGDGTTTSIILSSALCEAGNEIAIKHNPVEIRRGMESAKDAVVDYINKHKREITDDKFVENIATISSGSSKLGSIVTEAYKAVNLHGVVTFEESKSNKTFVEVVDGMRFDSGYMSPYFINQPQKKECVLENPYILITDMKLYNVDEIYPLLEQVAKTGRSLLIIADDVDGLALSTIIKNVMAGNLNCCCVKAPSYGEVRDTLLKDISLFTNGRVLSEKLSDTFNNLSMDDIGEARRIVITDTECTITSDSVESDNMKNEIALLEKQIANFDEDDKTTEDKKTLEERLARLRGRVAIVKVGGSTEVEMNEAKLRVEDAINAVRVSVESGVVAGEGRTYIGAIGCVNELVKDNSDFCIGCGLVCDVLKVPFERIFKNAGFSDDAIDEHLRSLLVSHSDSDGYDVFTDRWIADLFDEGVVDPASVSIGAIENAISVASMFITTEVAITFESSNDTYNPMI